MLKTRGDLRKEGKAHPAVSNEYDAIVERLKVLHPTLDPHTIRAAVEDAMREFEGARLQMFVPLLVEKIARDECRQHARYAASAPQ